MARVNWNAPTIALTVQAVLIGLAGLSLLAGDESALPPKMKTGNVHMTRSIGHELIIMCFLVVGAIVNNTAQQAQPFLAAGLVVSSWTHIMADDVGGGVLNLCIALMHFYFGLVWKEKEAAKKS